MTTPDPVRVSPRLFGIATSLLCITAFLTLSSFPTMNASSAGAQSSRFGSVSALSALQQVQNSIVASSVQGKLPKALKSQLSTALASTFNGDSCLEQPNSAPISIPCSFGDLKSNRNVILYGDSFALEWIPALTLLGSKFHFKLIVYSRLGCPFADVKIADWLGKVDPGCLPFRRNVVRSINQLSPKPILVLLSEETELRSPKNPSVNIDVSDFTRGNVKTLKQLKLDRNSIRVLLGEPNAGNTGSPGTCLATNMEKIRNCAVSQSVAFSNYYYPSIISSLTAAHFTYMNLSMFFCASVCPVTSGDFLVHSDNWHVNQLYAAHLAPAMAELIGCSGSDLTAAELRKQPIYLAMLPTLLQAKTRGSCRTALTAPVS